MAVVFTCEGCGYEIHDVMALKPPPHQLCSTCAWISEHMPGPEGMKAYDLAHGRQKAPKE